MTTPSRINWGMIGVGSVAEYKSGPAFRQALGGTLIGVASRRHDIARDYASRHDVPHVFNSASDLIASELVDAVYIATPPASHFPLALEIAKAGKPCCIEKPMTVYLRDAQDLCRAYDKAGLPLFVSYYRRSLPRFAAIAHALNIGAIGIPASVEWILGRPAYKSVSANNWRVEPSEAPGGLFEDLACHGLDLFDWFFGPVVEVGSSRLRVPAGQSVPDRVEARWRHGESVMGQGIWDFAAATRMDRVCVAGTRGTIRFSMFEDSPIEIDNDARSAKYAISNPNPIQLPHVIALNRAILMNEPHPSTGHSAARTAFATEAILRGANTRIECV